MRPILLSTSLLALGLAATFTSGAVVGASSGEPDLATVRAATERFRDVNTNFLGFGTVPTEAYRRGDFSAALTGRRIGTDPLGNPVLENVIYDPRTTRQVNGFTVRDPFPNM